MSDPEITDAFRAGFNAAQAILRRQLVDAMNSPAAPKVNCRCGRASLSSERQGRIAALGNAVEALNEAAPAA